MQVADLCSVCQKWSVESYCRKCRNRKYCSVACDNNDSKHLCYNSDSLEKSKKLIIAYQPVALSPAHLAILFALFSEYDFQIPVAVTVVGSSQYDIYEHTYLMDKVSDTDYKRVRGAKFGILLCHGGINKLLTG